MKVLVTGANGFLGSAVVQRLLYSTDYFVRCLVRPGSSHARLDDLISKYIGRVEIVYGLLSSSETCSASIQDIDIVFHLASSKNGAPAEMFQGSSVATKQLLDAIRATSHNIKLLHCSSFSVYGVAELPKGAMVDENSPVETAPHKRDLYAYSKWHQEQLVRQYAEQYGIPTAILRPGVIYGAGGSSMTPRVGLSLFGIFLFIGGDNTVPLTHVLNCADAFVVAAEHADYNGAIYNVVDDDLLTARKYLQLYRKNVENLKTIRIPYGLMMLISSACEWYFRKSKGQLPEIFTRYKTANMWKGNIFNNDKLKQIGWKPSINTFDGVRNYFYSLKTGSAK